MMCVVLYHAKNVIHNSDPVLLADSTLPCLNVYWLLSEDQMIMWVTNLDPVLSLDLFGWCSTPWIVWCITRQWNPTMHHLEVYLALCAGGS